MANITPRTIVLRALAGSSDEAPATGIFSPGHCLKQDNAGGVLKHATEGGFGAFLVAEEATLDRGKTIDDAYAVADKAFFRIAGRGEHLFVYLKAGVAYAIGDLLMQAGDGTLKKVSAPSTGVTVKQAVAEVMTAKNLSATGAVSARTSVRAL